MILVTGATGLVGSHLILNLIDSGEKVKALFRTEKNKERVKKVFEYHHKKDQFDKINWILGDILDLSSLELAFQGVTQVYHCAALISFDPKQEENLRRVNIEGTANVVNLSVDFGVQKLCYVSSIAALGDLKEYEDKITEETEWNPELPHSDYAISKYGAEMEVWRAYQEGLPVVIVNPGVVLGPLFWREGSGDIYNKVASQIPFYTNGGTGFVSVNDVVCIMKKLMESTISGQRFIVVAQTISYQEVTSLIADKLRVKKPIILIKSGVLKLAYVLDWFLGLFGKTRVLSKDMIRTLQTMDYYDHSKVKKAINVEFITVQDYLKIN
ncbi:NAD-dependent epimerase/dehydratase family protein [Flavobacterium columnare]|uniref:NAD-dependent epimerase/dehydratase family protein n=1 Tax=Flavobacterium columnare TaxID=996 RepID=A0AAI8CGD0_9FLAO|nr:NAD-dependent epimerase/dehydratase family protein [Flavobacterium columnare]AMO20217.1 NAD-dependent epimerase/dehydratase family protein [Flavobacterium columnare]AUX18171.1 NAD-dependent epimerase [Flavobacterium columnare]QOG57243.1 NAD-dependent epimerase/dehydratase family protein [Flavobacterium columnare]QOG59967.1 NAD-dependent epimerase/dehydratase family protein [Flavobacterium columnare]QOG62687.1 NAD-dependent epimerase/dehydratase family protein [Flavobacterium columnare]